MKTSIIIPAYNCSADLRALLPGVLRSRLAPREILVVDDGSVDDTATAAESYPEVRLVRLGKNRGPACARNAGAADSTGDVLVFIDADVTLPETPDVLARLAEILERRSDIDAVCAPSDIKPSIPNPIAYNASVYHAYYMDRIFSGRPTVDGRIMFFTTRLGGIRREAFRRSGGFYESLDTVMNEDGEFGTRFYHQGGRTFFDRALTHRHRYPTSFARFAKSYFLTAMVQAFVDGKMDTSPDLSVGGAEKLRRLWAAALIAAPALAPAVGAGPWLAAFGLALAGFILAFGRMNSLIRRAVPGKWLASWYAVYVLITPVILAGYAWGRLRQAAGRSLLRGHPSEDPFFLRVEAPR